MCQVSLGELSVVDPTGEPRIAVVEGALERSTEGRKIGS
jgi:hypothetical protein